MAKRKVDAEVRRLMQQAKREARVHQGNHKPTVEVIRKTRTPKPKRGRK